MNRRNILACFCAAAFVLSLLPAQAMEEKPFQRSAFETAQAASNPILLHVSAPWCETCQAQKAVLKKLESDPAFAPYSLFNIDFDSEKSVMRSFGVRGRSTLIAFKGRAEVGRLVGDTRAESIKALMKKGL